jgi:Uma2 family endonuclease
MEIQLSLFPQYPIISFPSPTLTTEQEEENDDDFEYPESNGLPMAENSKHFYILNYIKNTLDYVFRDKPDVFVAGDMLVYPKKKSKQSLAPDVLVAFNNHKNDRGAYVVHKEKGQIVTVFEITSPSNYKLKPDLPKRYHFYNNLKVKEYFIIHLRKEITIEVYFRTEHYLAPTLDFGVYKSDYLGVTFSIENNQLKITDKNQEELLDYVSEKVLREKSEAQALLAQQKLLEAENLAEMERKAREKAEAEKQKAEAEKQKAEAEKQKAEAEKQKAEYFIAEQQKELEYLRKLLAIQVEEAKEKYGK